MDFGSDEVQMIATRASPCFWGDVLSSFGISLKLEGGATGWRFFWSCPYTFLALRIQLVVLVSAFVMVSTVWSVSCLLFFYSWCPPSPCPAICKSWGARALPFLPPVRYGVGATVYYVQWLSKFFWHFIPQFIVCSNKLRTYMHW